MKIKLIMFHQAVRVNNTMNLSLNSDQIEKLKLKVTEAENGVLIAEDNGTATRVFPTNIAYIQYEVEKKNLDALIKKQK